jgi:hypothetical protein
VAEAGEGPRDVVPLAADDLADGRAPDVVAEVPVGDGEGLVEAGVQGDA